MARSYLPAGRIHGVAPLAASPSCIFTTGSGLIAAGGSRLLSGRVSVVERHGQSALAFAIDPHGADDVHQAARRGELAARVIGEVRGDVVIASGVELIPAQGAPTAWPGEFPRESVPDGMGVWWQPVFLAAMGIRGKASRSARLARPKGVGTLDLELFGKITPAKASLASAVRLARGMSINLHIDSEGGDVATAMAIGEALDQHDRRVAVTIAEASSAASLIAMAGDERRIDRGGSMTLHRPSLPGETSLRFAEQAQILAETTTAMARIIAAGTGQSMATARRWLAADVRFDAGMALQAGLVTSIVDAPIELENA